MDINTIIILCSVLIFLIGSITVCARIINAKNRTKKALANIYKIIYGNKD